MDWIGLIGLDGRDWTKRIEMMTLYGLDLMERIGRKGVDEQDWSGVDGHVGWIVWIKPELLSE